MKLPPFVLGFAAMIALAACDRPTQESPASKNDGPITLQQIYDRGIMGELGVPMGKVVVVEGTVVDGVTIDSKRLRAQYVLKVNSVNGEELTDKPIMEFYKAPGCSMLRTKALEDYAELREYEEIIVEDKDFKLSDEEFKKAHEAYVGSSLYLHVYEVGGYRGCPFSELPEGAYDWSDHGFWFRSHLSVLMSADSKGDIED